ncbi:MAG TPA: discoidin domain-containing protein [Nitrososphaeraceae archaeon]|nr:discoidin domain-containing protein [Nitrososphaeraceae archaeon]
MDNFKEFSSCTTWNRNLSHSLFFLFLFLIIIVIVGVTFSQSFSVYGQSVPLNSSQTCANVSVTRINSSGAETLHPPSHAIDNNVNTSWSSLGIGSWIQLDLGTNKNICSVDIAWYKGNERQYNFVLSASNDGVTFSRLFSNQSTGTTSSFEKYNVSNSNTNARYIRVTVNGNTQDSYANISEISVNAISISSNYTIGAAGDWGSARNDNWKKTVQLMIDNKVDLALGLGDYAYGGMKKFQPVVDELKKAGIPMKGAKGDHDSNAYAKMFGQPSMTFAFDEGPARIILLNSGKSPSSNAEYLERELNATRQPWKIVVATTPLYTSPSFHDADKAQRKALQPLLDKYGVDLVMWGDNHNYERIKIPNKHTVFIQSGTGGESHYNFKRQLPESVYQNDKDFGITKITMNNNTLTGQFISYAGKILDDFKMSK